MRRTANVRVGELAGSCTLATVTASAYVLPLLPSSPTATTAATAATAATATR